MSKTCELGPQGWYCTREDSHNGPCALIDEDKESTVMSILFSEFADENSVPLDEVDKYFRAARRIINELG